MFNSKTLTSLKNIRQIIVNDKDLGKSLNLTRVIIKSNDYLDISGLEEIENDYSLMKDYMLKGYKDPKQEEVYNGLLRQLFTLIGNYELSVLIRENVSYTSMSNSSMYIDKHPESIRMQLEHYVQEIAIESLSTDMLTDKSADIYRQHYVYMTYLFNAIVVSQQWNDSTSHSIEEILLSPTIDSNDVQLLLSAIMISSINIFDINKLQIFVNVYMQSDIQDIRQRALIGFIFSLPNFNINLFSNTQSLITSLTKEKGFIKQVFEMQMQIFYCLNTDADNSRIQRDIMPNLLKGGDFKITRFGIEENDEDTIKNILNSDKVDQDMEQMEKSFNDMVNMQKSGSDIYFGGFSHMKNFPFFKTVSNWFLPFSKLNPDVSEAINKVGDSKLIDTILNNGLFCNSDKYSFAMALSSIIERIPSNMRELLDKDGLIGHEINVDDKDSSSNIRRIYLQDLYRFYRLYQQRNDFLNPFEYNNSNQKAFVFLSPVLKNLISEDMIIEMAKFLYNHHYDVYLNRLLTYYHFDDNVDYLTIAAMSYMRGGRYYEAQHNYEKILEKINDNEKVLKGLAYSCFCNGDYTEACKNYEVLHSQYPDNDKYTLNLAISLIECMKVEEGMSLLFRLDYNHPNDAKIQRAIAWGYLNQNMAEKAASTYVKVIHSGKAINEDYINIGYCKWFLSEIELSIGYFYTYIHLYNDKSVSYYTIMSKAFNNDRNLLEKYSISETCKNIMIDLVGEHKKNIDKV